MLHFLEPYLLMPSALTPTALVERAEILLAEPLPDGAIVRLRDNPLYDAWLVRWPADGTLDVSGGYGAFAVASGALTESAADPDGVTSRTVHSGDAVGTRPGESRVLRGEAGAVSVHLFSPPRGEAPLLEFPAGHAHHATEYPAPAVA